MSVDEAEEPEIELDMCEEIYEEFEFECEPVAGDELKVYNERRVY